MTANCYPDECLQVLARTRPVHFVFARVGGHTLDDVRQVIAEAWIAGEDPIGFAAKMLGIRRLPSGEWRSLDPAVCASLAGELVDDCCVADGWPETLEAESTGIGAAVAGGTEAVARRCGVGRRAAQKRVKAQLRRFEESGDLFAAGGK